MEVITLVLGLLFSSLDASATGTPVTQEMQTPPAQESTNFIIMEETHP